MIDPPLNFCVKGTVYGTCGTILTYNIEITMFAKKYIMNCIWPQVLIIL